MAFCTNCGSVIPDGSAFCTQCGHKVGKVISHYTFPVVGMYYRMENIQELVLSELDYSKAEYLQKYKHNTEVQLTEFRTEPVALVPEPNNKHDKNAVKVMIGGIHVGYVPRGATLSVLKRLNSGRMRNLKATITGGRYMTVNLGTDLKERLRHYSKDVEITVEYDLAVGDVEE